MAVRRGDSADATLVEFYNIADFEAWQASGELVAGGWKLKYYKGLGTSTKEEAKEYFQDLKVVSYVWEEDGSSGDALDLAFNKTRANDRKAWLLAYDRKAGLDYGKQDVTFRDFVDRDLIHFSNYDIVRSIPSVCDGFKVSQRKIVHCCFVRNLTEEIKVAQLAGFVSEKAAYHHGEVSLNATIVGIAQDFVGANNVNLLLPNGQFGSRRQGGKDASAARYIYTELNPLASLIIPRDDDCVLNYLEDDGKKVEPDFFVPVLPLVLVNGAMGIGTGFSTNVPSYNPMDLVRTIRAMLDVEDEAERADGDGDGASTGHGRFPTDAPMFDLHPWYRDFTGTVEHVGDGKYFTRGRFHRATEQPTDQSKKRQQRQQSLDVVITELPVGYWTEDFVETVDVVRANSGGDIKAVKHNHTDSVVNCTVTFSSEAAMEAYMRVEDDGKVPVQSRLEKELKLVSNRHMSTRNMYLFNREGRIQKYDSVRDIMVEYFPVRLEAYAKRKVLKLAELERDMRQLANQSRFLKEVVDEDIVIHGKKKAELERELSDAGYDTDATIKSSMTKSAVGGEVVDTYDYLTRMPLYSLTTDKKEEVDAQLEEHVRRKREIEATSERDLWRADLDALVKAYEKVAKKCAKK